MTDRSRATGRPMFDPRIGSASDIFARMAEAAPRASVETGEGVSQPLAALNTGAEADIGVGLMRAWAAIGDILSFYQARITEESGLAGATSAEALRLIGAGVGAPPPILRPSRVCLSYSVGRTRAGPDSADIPVGAGAQTMTIPAAGEQPAVYENLSPLTARAGWDALPVVAPTVAAPAMISDGAISLKIGGAAPGLSAGVVIAIVAGGRSALRKITRIARHPGEGWSELHWKTPLRTGGARPVDRVISFRQSGALFGRRARNWADLPDAAKAGFGPYQGGVSALRLGDHGDQVDPSREPARVISRGLPFSPVRALAATRRSVFAGCGLGVYRRRDGRWAKCRTVQPLMEVMSLHVDSRGRLYAGSNRGAVAVSADDGDTWAALGPDLAPPRAPGLIRRMVRALLEKLLKITPPPDKKPAKTDDRRRMTGPVAAISSGFHGANAFVVVSDGRGVFRRFDADDAWRSFGRGLPGYNAATGLAAVTVHQLLVDPETGDRVFAATDQGLFRSEVARPGWSRIEVDPEHPGAAALSVAILDGVAYAGMDNGLFATTGAGTWERQGGGGGDGDGDGGRAPVRVITAAKRRHSGGDVAFVAAGGPAGLRIRRDGGGWSAAPLIGVRAFSTPDAWSADWRSAIGDGASEVDASAALRALFSARGADLPEGARIAPFDIADPSRRWRVFPPGRAGAETIPLFVITVRDDVLDVDAIVTRDEKTISAAVIDATGRLLTAGPPGAFLNADWPGYGVETAVLTLDRTVANARSGTVIALEDGAGGHALYPVVKVDAEAVEMFGGKALATRLTVSPVDKRLGLFPLRDSVVRFQSVGHAPYAPPKLASPMLTGDTAQVPAEAAAAPPGAWFAVTGRAPAASPPQGGGLILAGAAAGRALAGVGVSALNLTDDDMFIGLRDGDLLRQPRSGGAPVRLSPSTGPAIGPIGAIGAIGCARGALFAAPATGGALMLRLDGDEGAGAGAGAAPVWRATTIGAPGDVVSQFALSPSGTLFALTPAAVFALSSDGVGWLRAARAPEGAALRRIAFTREGEILAASSAGFLRETRDGALAVARASDGKIDAWSVAATPSGDIHVGADGDALRWDETGWTSLHPPGGTGRLTEMAADDAGDVFCGGPGTAPLRFSTAAGWAAASAAPANDVSAVAANGGVVIFGFGDRTWLRRADGARRAVSDTRIAVGGRDLLDGLDGGDIGPALRSSLADAGIRAGSDTQVLSGGDRAEWILRIGAASFRVRRLDEDKAEVLLTQTLSVRSGASPCRIEDARGYGLEAPADQIAVGPAPPDAAEIAETGRIAAVSRRGETAALRFTAPLSRAYDIRTAKISLNVSPALEGQSVTAEPLGDATDGRREFALLRGPLLAGADGAPDVSARIGAPGGGALVFDHSAAAAGRAPTAGTVWTRTRDLSAAGPADRVFQVIARPGGAALLFGDGVHGARLPEGASVAADYRIRTGPGGDPAAGSVRAFRRRPSGASGVVNPTKGAGGGGAPDTAARRAAISGSLTDPDRVVTLRDHQRFAEAFDGVVSAVGAVSGDGAAAHVAIVARPAAGHVAKRLLAALTARRAARSALTVARARPRLFRVALEVGLAPGAVEAEVFAAVVDALGRRFADCPIGAEITREDIASAARSAPGAMGARVTALYLAGRLPTLSASIAGALPAWRAEQGRFSRGEWLRLDPNGGVTINGDAQ